MFKAEDVKVLEAQEKVTQEHLNLTGDVARICLTLEQFKRYKEQYEKAESYIIETLLLLTNAYETGRINLETYGTKTLVYMTKLKTTRLLLSTIKSDSKKGKTDE